MWTDDFHPLESTAQEAGALLPPPLVNLSLLLCVKYHLSRNLESVADIGQTLASSHTHSRNAPSTISPAQACFVRL